MGGLRVISTGDVLSLVGRDLYTLGRVVKGQAVIPDIDLDPFNASSAGVSRIHAELIIQSDGIYIKDLESANGTFVNGDRIPSKSPFLIQHADILQLGRLRLQLISQ
jgi:pSer/pThr/pTyr-binding forkhead associated (FHA) protein